MNKHQLIAAASRRSSLTQRQTREALEAILEVIADALVEGEPVTISGFGRFDAGQYTARKLHRFDGPGHYLVSDRRVPVFRSSERLRQKLRKERP